jgi:hypothetical protein
MIIPQVVYYLIINIYLYPSEYIYLKNKIKEGEGGRGGGRGERKKG